MSKRIFISLGAVSLLIIVAVGVYVGAAVRSVPYLFKRNAELKAQGYYVAEFEFKMVAVQYYLNESRYVKAFTTLGRIRTEMETTRGLVKMPRVASPREMTSFLLQRQDPTTGAFMDPSYPYFTYISPTLNAVEALSNLTRRTGQTLKLKYPLRFLDKIRSPDQLRRFLNSNLYLHAIWAKFGGPGPYVADSELAYFDELERSGVYQFSTAWTTALRGWFYETQDPTTGFWGTRIGNPAQWRQDMDANSTYHVLHLVLDAHGNDRSKEYPLRYAGKLAHNLLKMLNSPIPKSAPAQHDWSLVQAQGTETITRLWNHLSDADRADARTAMQTFLRRRYHFYRPADGGFSLYTASDHADVDGTANALALLRATGSLPGTWERERLWGPAISAARVIDEKQLDRWAEATLPNISVNSIRVYADHSPQGDLLEDTDLVQIVYPQSTSILDVMDLRQRLAGFIAMPGNDFGNWTSKQDLTKTLDLGHAPRTVPIISGRLDLASVAKAHPQTAVFDVVGYNEFQVPVYKIEFRLAR